MINVDENHDDNQHIHQVRFSNSLASNSIKWVVEPDYTVKNTLTCIPPVNGYHAAPFVVPFSNCGAPTLEKMF